MSFFPEGVNPRDPVLFAFTLVAIDTPDGICRFLPEQDGVFTDIDGNVWHGSNLLSLGILELAIQGTAPIGNAKLSYFQDPDEPELIAEVQELGIDYIKGRDLTVYVQPFTAEEQMRAPVFPPIPYLTRRMTKLKFDNIQQEQRAITLFFEGPNYGRRGSRGLYYNVIDHEALIGESNPSLQFRPTYNSIDQKIW